MGRKDRDRYCPDCGKHIWRLRDDKFLKCHRCGWTKGWPLVRWFTTISWLRYYVARLLNFGLLRFVLLVGVFVATTAGAASYHGVDAVDLKVVQLPDLPDGGYGGSAGSTGREGINARAVERQVHQMINNRRAQNGLDRLEHSGKLGRIASYHSRDMAESDYFSHTSPSGETISDRYDRFNYNCRIPKDGGGYLTGGAENIAYTEGSNPRDVAEKIVNMWMSSQPHRENILNPHFRKHGIGVAVGDSGKIYVTQNFC